MCRNDREGFLGNIRSIVWFRVWMSGYDVVWSQKTAVCFWVLHNSSTPLPTCAMIDAPHILLHQLEHPFNVGDATRAPVSTSPMTFPTYPSAASICLPILASYLRPWYHPPRRLYSPSTQWVSSPSPGANLAHSMHYAQDHTFCFLDLGCLWFLCRYLIYARVNPT